jgi:hypothetical protein
VPHDDVINAVAIGVLELHGTLINPDDAAAYEREIVAQERDIPALVYHRGAP